MQGRGSVSMSELTEPQPVEPPQRSQQTVASFLQRRTVSRLRARRVRRLVRYVEPWSVLKMSLIFYFCLWVILLIAGVILWRFAVTSGTVDKLESFVEELFALETFTLNPDQIFRVSALGGLVMVVAGSGFTVLMAVLFNLISDLVGGVRMTVVEEETARPRPKRTRPRTGTPAAAKYVVAPPQEPAAGDVAAATSIEASAVTVPPPQEPAAGDVASPQEPAAREEPIPDQASGAPFWPGDKRRNPKSGSLSKWFGER